MVDKNCLNMAQLVGLAKIGALSARTHEALDQINEVSNHFDYRDDLPDVFYEQIRMGNIRTDAEWDKGSDAQLLRLL